MIPCRIDAIKPHLIEFRDPMPGTMSGQFVSMFYEDSKICIQTPKMECLGCNKWQFNAQAPEKYTLLLRCSPAFVKWCECLDDFVLRQAERNSIKWLGQEFTASAIKTWFQPTIKQDYHGDPIIRLSVPFKGPECQVAFFDQQGNYLDAKDVPSGDVLASAVLEIEGLWFVNRKFGLRIKLAQAKLHDGMKKYAFLADDD
jgi:hypothetical protein